MTGEGTRYFGVRTIWLIYDTILAAFTHQRGIARRIDGAIQRMSTIQVELPFDTLLTSLQQLNAEELTELAQHAARLGAQHQAHSLTQAETDLLLEINQGIVSPAMDRRCAELTKKQRAAGLSDQEQAELMTLVDEIELLNARRLGYLVELANIRQISVNELMASLQIKSLTYG